MPMTFICRSKKKFRSLVKYLSQKQVKVTMWQIKDKVSLFQTFQILIKASTMRQLIKLRGSISYKKAFHLKSLVSLHSVIS